MRSGSRLFQPNRLKPFAVIGISLIAIMAFQNFTSIPLEKLSPGSRVAKSMNPHDGSADIRDLAPNRPDNFGDRPWMASPQAGHDLNSISQDWMSRQANLITGGAEQELLASLNRKIERSWKFEPIEGEPWPDSADDDQGSADGKNGEKEESSRVKPKSIKLTGLNRLQMEFTNRTNLSCAMNGGSLQIDVSHPIGQSLDLNIRHESTAAKSSVMLNYSW